MRRVPTYALVALALAALAAAAGVVVGRRARRRADASGADAPDVLLEKNHEVATCVPAAAAEGGPMADAASGPEGGGKAVDDGVEVVDVDFDTLMAGVMASGSPIRALREVVGDIHAREADGLADDSERVLARWLEEAGLMRDDVRLPHLGLARLGRTSLYYLGTPEPSMSGAARERILSVESAINRMKHADMLLGDVRDADERELYRTTQGLSDSVCSQALPVSRKAVAEGDQAGRGEWALRTQIALQLESWQLPHRLEARFRCDAGAGLVAIEFRVTPGSSFPHSRWSSDLGRVIPTTTTMRGREAASYALRVGLLLAAGAFSASGAVSRVCVAGVRDDGAGHACLLSAEFRRASFALLDLDDARWPEQAYHSVGGRVRIGRDGLEPVEQGFLLDEQRFCPINRQMPVELAWHPVEGDHARALGTDEASGLAVDPDALLDDFAHRASLHAGDSTAALVGPMLDLARQTEEPRAMAAAERCALLLADGALDSSDGNAIEEELCYGDGSPRMVARAFALAAEDRHEEALRTVLGALSLMGAGRTDPPGQVTRSFRSYAERVLYNRLLAEPHVDVRLAPPALEDAHLLAASLLMRAGEVDAAMEHAKAAARLDPLDERAALYVVRIFETNGELELAAAEAEHVLPTAHTTEALGVTYYRLAFLRWRMGDAFAAETCYRKSLRFPSTATKHAALELQVLLVAAGPQLGDEPSPAEVDEALRAADVPVAPEERVVETLAEATSAAVDEGLFPVARALSYALAGLVRDDVVVDVADSLEGVPDRL